MRNAMVGTKHTPHRVMIFGENRHVYRFARIAASGCIILVRNNRLRTYMVHFACGHGVNLLAFNELAIIVRWHIFCSYLHDMIVGAGVER
jgi:hypothetical protein